MGKDGQLHGDMREESVFLVHLCRVKHFKVF